MCDERVVGVYFDNHMQRWVGRMTKGGTTIRGVFSDRNDAISFRKELEKEMGNAELSQEMKDNMKKRIYFNKETQEFGITEIQRPQNYCREDGVFAMVIDRGRRTFSKVNLTNGDVSDESFGVAQEVYRIIYNKNATIVILEDGTKGVAKCEPNDIFSRRVGEEFAYGRAKAKSLKKKYGHVK